MKFGYPDNVIVENEVKRFIDETRIDIKKKGDEYVFRVCPFCKGGSKRDKDTFSINYLNGQYHCKRGKCGEKGNLWTITKDDRFEYKLPEIEKEIRKHTSTFQSSTETDERAEDWILENRGIPKEITRKYHVAFGTERFKKLRNKDGNMILSKPRDFLVWQFSNPAGDTTLYYKFRRTVDGTGAKEWSLSNDFMIDGLTYHAQPCLYGMGECDYRDDFVIMTEGQFDTLAVAAAGFGNVVSVPTGKNGFTWYDDAETSKDFLKRFKILIIFGDREGYTITLLDDMKKRFKGIIKYVRLDDYKDCKDANEILKKYGAEQIKACVNNAVQVPIKGLKKMRDIKRMNLKDMPSIRTGIPTLDRYIKGMFFGQVITLTGRSGDGKTTLASQIVTFALQQEIPMVVYSGEFTGELIKNFITLQVAGPNHIETTPDGSDVSMDVWDRIEDWYPYAELFNLYEVDYDLDEDEEDQESMLDTVERAILQAGVKFVLIDNLMTAMEYTDDNDLNKKQSLFMKKLKRMATVYEVIIMLVAHPKKAAAYTKKSVITKEDIAGSSNIGNLSDTIIAYSMPQSDGVDWQREIIVLKNRWNNNEGVGIPIHAFFNKASKRISETKCFDWDLGWETDFHEIEAEQITL